ncbi:MAG: M23 family metallopeptidase [Clostridiales bacterium]
MNIYHIHKNHFWQLGWWREDSRRGKAAISCALLLLLLSAYLLADQKKATEQKNIIATAGAPIETTKPDVTVIARDQVKLPASPENTVSSPAETAVSGEQPSLPVIARGIHWRMPATGEFSRAFGYDYDLTYDDFRFHKGCDMKLPIGELIYAAADGTVISATTDDVWGGIIAIDHGSGWVSVYKCVNARVSIGDPVSAGESIGSIVDSPPAEAAQVSHLHFEVYLDEEAVDPLPLF